MVHVTTDRKRRRLAERLRWKIVGLIVRLPGQCWSSLVSWALDGPRHERRVGKGTLPWRPNTACREDFERTGWCYCGKLRRPDLMLEAADTDGPPPGDDRWSPAEARADGPARPSGTTVGA